MGIKVSLHFGVQATRLPVSVIWGTLTTVCTPHYSEPVGAMFLGFAR